VDDFIHPCDEPGHPRLPAAAAKPWQGQAFESDPRCAWAEDGVRCERIGEELDHVVPLDARGDEYAASNLQLLCAEHHRLKTGHENRERRVR